MKQATLNGFSFTIPGTTDENGVWRPTSAGYGSVTSNGVGYKLIGFSEQAAAEHVRKYKLPENTRIARIEYNFRGVGVVYFHITEGTKEERAAFFEEQRLLLSELQESAVDPDIMMTEKMEIGRAEIRFVGYEPIAGKLYLRCSKSGNPTYSVRRDRYVPKMIGQVEMF